MTEYIITPDKRDIPSSHLLSEELHRRAISVEMEVKGTNYKWESIHFYDPAIPETQCFVERNLNSHVFKISLPFDSTQESAEMQHALVEIFLHEVGGAAFDVEAKQSYDLKKFRGHTKGSSSEEDTKSSSSSSSRLGLSLSAGDSFWLVFAWVLVFFGLYVYLHASDDRKMLYLAVDLLALVGAGGMTYSLTRPK
jgi:hypothetical protein